MNFRKLESEVVSFSVRVWILYSLLFFLLLIISCKKENPEYQTWRVYKGDSESSCYSSLDQINKDNVGNLQIAWTFRPGDAPPGSRYGKYECNPIVINDIMYATSARHWLYAVNAKTGEMIWSFDPFDGGRGGGMYRGVAYWEDKDDKRVLFTAANYLYAIDAGNGKPVVTFGNRGKVDLSIPSRSGPEAWVIPTSPGIVYNDLLILGGEVSEVYGAAPGDIRAFNIRTGEIVWTFHTIPHPAEAGYETWPEEAWTYTGGANNWGGMSLDMHRGIVYIPTGSPTYDYYGADRKGANLYGNSLVALDASTGKYIWHFQTVHHDLWDYDLPAAPNLLTVKHAGRKVDAAALTTKTGFLFLFDRTTGKPLFPVEERNVPVTNIDGEETWPTQPFPLKPAPYAKQHLTEDDLIDDDSVRQVFAALRYEGMYTPPDLQGTFMYPGSRGGSEWGGAAHDPTTGILYINANESPEIARIKKVRRQTKGEGETVYNLGKRIYESYCASCHGNDRGGMEPNNPPLLNLQKRMNREEVLTKIKTGVGRMPAFAHVVEGQEDEIISFLFELKKDEISKKSVQDLDTTSHYMNTTAYSNFRNSKGQHAIKPPWGTLSAINLNTGEYEWKIPLGNYPELQEAGAPPTGTENWGGPIVTAGGLVFIAATMDDKFRAFDKTTGELVWETKLPGRGFATPATYMIDGKQYLSISVTGGREEPGGYIITFALP